MDLIVPLRKVPTTLTPPLDGMLESATEQYATLQQARPKPYIFDDFTIQRVIQVYTNQKKDVPLFTEQLRRWQTGDITDGQRAEIECLTGQMSRLDEVIDAILTLADELQLGTIERVMSKSDAELGLEMLFKMMKNE